MTNNMLKEAYMTVTQKCYSVTAPGDARPDVAQIASSVRQLLGRGPVLELALTHLTLDVRCRTTEQDSPLVAAVIQQLYPGAKLEPVAARGDDENAAPRCSASVNLRLARPLPFPLRTWDSFRPTDPVAALGGAVRQLQPGEQLESQLTLSPQKVDWRPPVNDARYQTPLARLLNNAAAVPGLGLMGAFGSLFALGALYGDNLFTRLLGSVGLLALGLGLWLGYRYFCWLYELPGLGLDQVKSQDALFAAALTLTARAATPERAALLLAQWQDHYHVFDAGGGGNHWVAESPSGLGRWLDRLRPLYLSATEIAGHWHLPVDARQSPFAGRQGYRPLMPPPLLLDPLRLPQGSFPLGHYLDGSQSRAVYVPRDTFTRHTLVLGETQSGKSRLVERLCEGLLANPEQSLMVIDPHSSLVRRLAGKIPEDRQASAVVWDLGRTDQPIPLNLLAAPGADQAPNVIADQIVDDLRTQWADSWGPRLEYYLGYALRTLLAARLPELPTRPGFHPFIVTDIQSLITDADFRSAVLNTLTDADLKRYWQIEFPLLLQHPHLFQEVCLPILNKVGAYVQREPARHTVGQFAFTPILENVLTRPGCVLVDLAPSVIGGDTARLVASTLLLTLRNLVAQRQHQPPATWKPITVVVDELQWLKPGSLDKWMAELTKFGVNLVVITQSLELLDAADPHLRAQVLANVSNLFTFSLMADDARRIAPQFDGEVSVNDLLNLPPRHSYAKVAALGRRQPVFSLEVWPVVESNPRLAEALAAQTTTTYGVALADLQQASAERQTVLMARQQRRVSRREPARRS